MFLELTSAATFIVHLQLLKFSLAYRVSWDPSGRPRTVPRRLTLVILRAGPQARPTRHRQTVKQKI